MIRPNGTDIRCDGRKLAIAADGLPKLRPTCFHPEKFVGGMWVPCLCSRCNVPYYEGDPFPMPPLPRSR
jgi:hypothetical protein